MEEERIQPSSSSTSSREARPESNKTSLTRDKTLFPYDAFKKTGRDFNFRNYLSQEISLLLTHISLH